MIPRNVVCDKTSLSLRLEIPANAHPYNIENELGCSADMSCSCHRHLSAIKGINERQYVVVFNKRRLDKMKLRSSYKVLSAYTFQSSASQCLIIISACPHHIDTSVKSDPSICQIPVCHNALAVFVWVCCVTCLMTE